MFFQIIALGPKNGPDPGSIILHRLIKGNVKNLQLSDSGPLWPSCFRIGQGLCTLSLAFLRNYHLIF